MKTKTKQVAALDAGSNSFHVIVAEVGEGRTFRVIDRAKEMVRLGDGALLTHRIPQDVFARGIDALVRLRETAERHGPVVLLANATATIREAENGAEFIRAAQEQAGVSLRVVSPDEEARLVYLGARRSLGPAFEAGTQRVALFDLGGGSLEIIVADRDRIHFSRSLPLGGLRLAQTRPLGDPPTGRALTRLRAAIDEALAPTMTEIAGLGYQFLALVSGTANAVRGLLAQGARDESAPARVGQGELLSLERRLAELPIAERARLPGLDPKRADSIVPGVAVLRAIVGLSGRGEATFCTGAMREGMIADYLGTVARAEAPPRRTVLGGMGLDRTRLAAL
ncbi:MAG: hypothetical protein ABUL77_04665 [Bacteroidota bacterium]